MQTTQDSEATQGQITKLPDGSACFVGNMPLPKTHWIYKPSEELEQACVPVIPTTDTVVQEAFREQLRKEVSKAVKRSLNICTHQGTDMDFDPDAVVQTLLVELLGKSSTTTRLM
jgi:hypothetical protein